jgi:hypothetical protein
MSISFDFWMSKGKMDTFALVINYLNNFWNLIHVSVGLFEVHEITWFSIVGQLHTLLEKLDLMHYVIAFVKNEGSNLMFMATTLHSIVDCQPLKL